VAGPGSGWELSALNVPSPGTVASYRKGRYHCHETATEWRVHLDRYDPKIHPFLHLADDAPLLLMIADTFGTLLQETRRGGSRDTRLLLEDQETTWQRLILAGLSAGAIGCLILLDPLVSFQVILTVLIPLLLVALGVIALARNIWGKMSRERSGRDLLPGLITIITGVIAFFLPLETFAGVILGILAVWAIGSALLSFGNLTRGRISVPEGFSLRLVIGGFSLLLAVLISLNPVGAVHLLMVTVGVLALLVGLVQVMDGIQLWRRMVGYTGADCPGT
jgi:uncharacterized membrane protein HdeD (DUF308 family)